MFLICFLFFCCFFYFVVVYVGLFTALHIIKRIVYALFPYWNFSLVASVISHAAIGLQIYA